jgi:hypothetical protein
VPCQVWLASSGMRTWKLKDSVPTRAIMPSGIHSPGLALHVAHRARSSPRARCTGAGVASAAGSIRARATSMATKDRALRAKHVLTREGDDRARRWRAR